MTTDATTRAIQLATMRDVRRVLAEHGQPVDVMDSMIDNHVSWDATGDVAMVVPEQVDDVCDAACEDVPHCRHCGPECQA